MVNTTVILGIDHGNVRTGIAATDEQGMMAFPVMTVTQTYMPKLIAQIAEIIKERNCGLAVVGLPRNMDGTEGSRADECREFAAALSQSTGIKVELIDERLTTVQAARDLTDAGVFGKKRKNSIDTQSAVLILQSYLDKEKRSQ